MDVMSFCTGVLFYLGPQGIGEIWQCLMNIVLHPVSFFTTARRVFYDGTYTRVRAKHFFKININAYSKRFTFKERCKVFCAHFDFVSKWLGLDYMEEGRGGKLLLWQRHQGEVDFALYLQPARELNRYEGELLVTMEMGDKPLFRLGFVICNPEPCSGQRVAAFITRLQGVHGRYPEIKYTCKTFDNLNLSSMLLASLAGLCNALNIECIMGVDVGSQVSYASDRDNFSSTYERFWSQHNADVTQGGLHIIPAPFTNLVAGTVTSGHKSRSLKHSNLRSHITQEACDRIHHYILR